MKHLILMTLTAAVVLFSGCASTGADITPPTHYNHAEQATTQFPSSGEPGKVYGYARGQASENQFDEAARQFEQAAGIHETTQE